MHVFKLRSVDYDERVIERTTFDHLTDNREPWYVKDGEKDYQYGVCPCCNNPIRIVGLYRPLPHTDKPYGRHTGKRIEGFPHFDADALEWCPFVKKRKRSPAATKRKLDDLALQILARVLHQFDRIIYLLQKETGMQWSNRFSGELLDGWLCGEGYLYPGSHLRNIPWMVAYRSRGISIFGQKIVDDDNLIAAITRKIPGALIDDSGRITKHGPFYEIGGVFLGHNVTTGSGDLKETICFRVHGQRRQHGPAFETVYSRTIHINPARFDHLVNTPPGRARRHQGFLDLAQQAYQKILPRALLARVHEVIKATGPEEPI